MKNLFLLKIQTSVQQRKHIHNNFLSIVSRTTKIQNFDHQNWSDFFCCCCFFLFFWYKNLCFFARLKRVLYFWLFNCQISACRFLYAGFYCIAQDHCLQNESTSFDRYLYVLGQVIITVKTNSKTTWTFFFVTFIIPLYPDEKLN